MRIGVIVSLALIGAASQANAFDLGPLRGSQLEFTGVSDWSGVYGGAHWGYSTASIDFAEAASGQIGQMTRRTAFAEALGMSDWPVLGQANPTGTHFGGFVGYNFQWDAAVFGVEINYNRTSLTSSASDSMARQIGGPIVTVDPVTNVVTSRTGTRHTGSVSASASATLTDFATLRLRAGHSFGQFMPYGFVAGAVGRANYSVSSTVTGSTTHYSLGGDQFSSLGPVSTTESGEGAFVYGGAVGLGFDMLLASNLFVRAEWEYVQFQKFHGMHLSVNSVRAGAGVKF